MHIAKEDIPVRIDAPGTVVRQDGDFGDATGYGAMGGEYLTVQAGTDLAPLLKGLKDDMCQAPHWGYVLGGEVTVTYADGKKETDTEGQLFYWPPGHTLRFDKDTQIVMFSPREEHLQAMNNVIHKMGG